MLDFWQRQCKGTLGNGLLAHKHNYCLNHSKMSLNWLTIQLANQTLSNKHKTHRRRRKHKKQHGTYS